MAASSRRDGSILYGWDLRLKILVATRSNRGFTFLEAILALTLSSLIVALVASVFLAQNDFYRLVVERAEVQNNLRVITNLIASEARGVSNGGFTTATERRFVIRMPLAVGGVCHGQGSHGRVYMPGLSNISSGEVAGYARQDVNGDWVFTADTWSNLLVSSGLGDAEECESRSGADTVGALDDFGRLLISGGTTLGESIMIWQEIEFQIAESVLDPTTLAVFRGVTGDGLREFATGLTPDTKFEYSINSGVSYTTSVTGSDLDNIQIVRLTASAIASDSLGLRDAYDYSWTLRIPMKNTN